MAPSLSSVVITYNRIGVVETCLRSARFADELIVVDKGSTDGTAEIGRRMADKFVQVPWSPTVEETRADAIALATAPWVLSLDDDECLNAKAIEFVLSVIQKPVGQIYYLPYRNYVLGRHDERAYYWPEYRPVFFRQGAIKFDSTVHGGVHPTTDDQVMVLPDTGIAITHLSHQDAGTWIEKANRYTSRPQRTSIATARDVTPRGIIALMERYLLNVPSDADDGYLAAVAALRGIYDVIDAVKRWEDGQAVKGEQRFAEICRGLEQEYDELAQKLKTGVSEPSWQVIRQG